MIDNEQSPMLRMHAICKNFPGIKALNMVDFELYENEIVALIGENGAGKSTLMKILGGIFPPDSGDIYLKGKKVQIQNVSDAISKGIGFIHQELNVFDNLDIAGNIFLGREPSYCGILKLLDTDKINKMAEYYLKILGLEAKPDTGVETLSIAQKQLVEIANVLSLDAKILIMDEPTSSLSVTETDRLFEIMQNLKTKGVSIIFISHRLPEVEACADRVIVLRDGVHAGTLPEGNINHDNMIRLMIGRKLESYAKLGPQNSAPDYFRVKHLKTATFPESVVSFCAAQGEILGFAGLLGAGRTEMARAIFGVDNPLGGDIILEEKVMEIKMPRDSIKNGIYLVPDDRSKSGLIGEFNIRENITLPSLKRYAYFWMLHEDRERQLADDQCEILNIKTHSTEVLVKNLSGGNQQKVVLSKWLAMEPKVIILDEPTRGVDVGTKVEIYKLLRNLAESGTLIIIISSELEELLRVCDRIAVMREGSVSGILERDDFSEKSIMRLAVSTNATKVTRLRLGFASRRTHRNKNN